MRRLQTLALLAAITIISCKKEEGKTYTITPIKKITIQRGDSVYYRHFLYDVSGRLASQIDSNNNGNVWSITTSYDAQGRLSGYTVNPNNLPSTTYSFQYDNNGRIVKKQQTSSSTNPYPAVTTYRYDANGRLLNDSTYGTWVPGVTEYTNFTYNQDGNLVNFKRYSNYGSGFHLVDDVQMQYNDHPSPYYTAREMYYMSQENEKAIYLSPNNCTQQIYPDGTITNYAYQYYADGSPGSCIVSDNDGSVPEHFAFFY